jgi:hypothetical protein
LQEWPKIFLTGVGVERIVETLANITGGTYMPKPLKKNQVGQTLIRI